MLLAADTNVLVRLLCWVLESTFGYGRDDLARAVEAIMTSSPFELEDPFAAREALDHFRKGKADFSDHMVLAVSRARGAGRLLTFDGKLLRHAECEKP